MLFTDLPKEKQSDSIFVIITEHRYVRYLSILDIGWAEGLKIIIDKLDEIYLWDPNTSTNMTFKEFNSYERDNGIDINDLFCVKYSKLVWGKWKIIKDYTCASFNYATIKETLKQVFSDISSLEYKNVCVVKEEVEMMNFNFYRNSLEKNLIKEEIDWIPLIDKVSLNTVLNIILLDIFHLTELVWEIISTKYNVLFWM